jgi:ribose transport system ATP-binding protein
MASNVATNDNILEMNGITKQFPGTVALDSVDFHVRRGEVHALVGENGAGKSTLIKVLSGVYQPDSGQIIYDGKSYAHMDPSLAVHRGIHLVYQEPNVFLLTSVLENLFLTEESFYKRGIVQRREATKRAREVLDQLNMNVGLNQFVYRLTRGQKQMLSIARAIVSRPKILVLDEPTAPLTGEEISTLFRAMHKLQEQGVSMIYVSHRLQEIFDVGDRITVLRDGKNAGFHQVKNLEMDQLIREIVAKSIEDKYPKEDVELGKPIFAVEGLASAGSGDDVSFRDVSFNIREGEIFGVAGVVGSGKSALGKTLFGLTQKSDGKILVSGREVDLKTSHDAVANGIVLIPEDRRAHGIVPDMSVEENIMLPNLDEFSSAAGWVKRRRTRAVGNEYTEKLSIRTPSVKQLVAYLSGGNQQKVVVAKWLCSQAKVFVFAEMTAGIDIGAKTEIYRLLGEICRAGGCVIMISSEFEELLGMCDRIMVLYRGERIIESKGEDLDMHSLLRYAVGGGQEVDSAGAGGDDVTATKGEVDGSNE